MGTILFFEDDDVFAERTKKNLTKKFKSSISIELAKKILSERNKEQTIVNSISEDIEKLKNIELIVADVNLYNIKQYGGLSAEVVSEVGRRLFIPVCIYSINVKPDLDKIKKLTDATLKIEGNPNSAENLTKIKSLYDGFLDIKRKYRKLNIKLQNESLPRILSTILDKPQYVDRFALYSLGNFGFFDYAPLKRKHIDKDFKTRAISYLLGNWLLSIIMKFPGILLNKIAAASYLNIDINDFNKKSVNGLFSKALYKGPFSDYEKYWWRFDLDTIIDKNRVDNGLELARKKISLKIKSCNCSIDKNLNAGYYCIITKAPVSLEKSTNEISWIPKGADLARVSIREYNKLKPWMGII